MKPSTVDHTRDQAEPPPMRMETINCKRQSVWEIQKILGTRRNLDQDGQLEFEVKWKGLKDCTWEPIESFEKGGMEALEEFIETELEKGTVKEPEDYGFATVIYGWDVGTCLGIPDYMYIDIDNFPLHLNTSTYLLSRAVWRSLFPALPMPMVVLPRRPIGGYYSSLPVQSQVEFNSENTVPRIIKLYFEWAQLREYKCSYCDYPS
jgi:hypothetical protein